jgi:hypothetical protein
MSFTKNTIYLLDSEFPVKFNVALNDYGYNFYNFSLHKYEDEDEDAYNEELIIGKNYTVTDDNKKMITLKCIQKESDGSYTFMLENPNPPPVSPPLTIHDIFTRPPVSKNKNSYPYSGSFPSGINPKTSIRKRGGRRTRRRRRSRPKRK